MTSTQSALVAILWFWTVGPDPAAGADPPGVASALLEAVDDARLDAGVPSLDRRPALVRVAQDRATQIAKLPHAERLNVPEPIAVRVRAAGITRYRNVLLHVDMLRGYPDPAQAFAESWRKHSSWPKVLGPRFDAIGLATARGEDGWLVLVAVLLEDDRPPADLDALERSTLRAVNAERVAAGLTPLGPVDALREVARQHSRDMAKRGFFDHRSPEGAEVADRIRATGHRFRKLAENLHRGRGADDPAAAAVASWMGSPAHRETILTPGFVETGLGVAVGEDGWVYFTQVFVEP